MCDQDGQCPEIFKGQQFRCYASEDERSPTLNQFCGFEKDGMIVGAPGCCSTKCPNKNCPSVPANPWPNYKIAPTRLLVSEMEEKPKPTQKPISKLLKLALIIAVVFILFGVLSDVLEASKLEKFDSLLEDIRKTKNMISRKFI
jgi:hypothetical protein